MDQQNSTRPRKGCAGVQALRPRCTPVTYRCATAIRLVRQLLGAVLSGASLSAWLAAPARAFADPACEVYVREVLSQQTSVQAGALRRDALLRESSASGIWPDPNLTVMGDYLPGTERSTPMPMVRVQVTQTIMWPGKLPLMREAVRSEADAAGANLEARKLDLALEARRSFFMFAMNEKRRELNRAARGLASTIAMAALGRYASQVGGHHEVVRAELDVHGLDVEYEALSGEQRSMLAMLNALRSRSPETPIARPQSVSWTPAETHSADRLATAAIQNRPELRAMSAMKEGMSRMASLARKERYPDLMVGGWYNQMLMGSPNSFGVMVGGTIPVFGVERTRLKADAFEHRADAASRDTESMRVMVRAQVADAWARFETAGSQVALLETRAVPKGRENFNTSLSAYSTGSLDVVGVLDSRRALQALELMLIEARVAREIALALLQRAVGGPLPIGAP
jgi:outer membrane protein TolC